MSEDRLPINEENALRLSEWATKMAEDARLILETSGPRIVSAIEAMVAGMRDQR